MKKIISLCTIISIFIPAYLSIAKQDLRKMIPEDSILLLEFDNIGEFSNEIEEGPIGEFAKSTAWEKISQWMLDELKKDFSKKSKKDQDLMTDLFSDWSDSFNGKFLFSLSGIDQLIDKKAPSFILLVETDLKDADLEETIDSIKKEVISSGGKFAWSREEISGENVHLISPGKGNDTQIALTVFDQTLGIFLGGKELVEEAFLQGSGNSKADTILDNDNYLDLFDEIDRGKARMFINFGFLEDFFEDLKTLPDVQLPENPFGINTTGLIKALGMDSLECMGLQIDPTGKAFTISSGIYLNKYDGLFSFIQSGGGDAITYDFISPESFTASTGRYDFAKLWPTVEKLVGDLSPQLLLLMNAQIQAFEDQAGVPFRRDVLGSFGDEMVSFSFLDTDSSTLDDFNNANPTFYAVSLKDSKLFDRTLRSLIDAFSSGSDLFEERVHRGVTIRKIRGMEQAGISVSYAVTNKWFLVGMGDDTYLNQIINRMDGKGKSLWENRGVRSALESFPDGVRQIDYVNFDQMMTFIQPIIMDAINDETELNLKSKDFPSLPYFLLAWSKDVKNGIIGRAELFPVSSK